MKRFAVWFLAFFAAFALAAVNAADFQEGVDYELISPAQPTHSGNKIEVIEMFWYGCPHCYEFDPSVQRWSKRLANDVAFSHMPAIFRPEWELHARAYYAAEMLDALNKLHPAMFTAIHELRNRLSTEQQLMSLFAEHGVSEADFKRTFPSFAVESKVRRAKDMTKRYQIDGVPAMIINGKYRTSPSMTNSYDKMLKVVDFLIEKERAAR